MRTFVEMPTIALVEESCICNKCGKSYSPTKSNNVVQIKAEFLDYGTTYENQIWNFDLCAECLVEVFKSFKLAPEGFMQDYTETSFIKNHQEVFEQWKVSGKWEEYLGYTYEELVGLNDGYYHNVELVNALIREYYPERELIKENE